MIIFPLSQEALSKIDAIMDATYTDAKELMDDTKNIILL